MARKKTHPFGRSWRAEMGQYGKRVFEPTPETEAEVARIRAEYEAKRQAAAQQAQQGK